MYEGDSVNIYQTNTDFQKIGNISLSEMKTLPFYSIYYKGNMLKRTDDVHCKETGGDCFEFMNKYLIFNWQQWNSDRTTYQETNFKPHIC